MASSSGSASAASVSSSSTSSSAAMATQLMGLDNWGGAAVVGVALGMLGI